MESIRVQDWKNGCGQVVVRTGGVNLRKFLNRIGYNNDIDWMVNEIENRGCPDVVSGNGTSFDWFIVQKGRNPKKVVLE